MSRSLSSWALRIRAFAATLAVIPFCPMWVYEAETIAVDVRYAHEATPGSLYTLHLGPHIAWDTGEASVVAEGHPVGCQWWINGQPMVFRDGFETGDTGRWE